jgi:hypothetical protein
MDNQNQYQFIIDPSQGTSSGPTFLQDPKKRNIVAVLFVTVILLLVFVAIAIFSSLSSKNTSAIIDVAAYQTELVRISTLGLKEARDPSVRAQIATMQSFTQSDLIQTTSYLSSVGTKFEKELTTLKLDTAIDKNLESAALRNTYDQEIIEALATTSTAYKISLQKALNDASSDEEKTILEKAASNILTYENLQLNSGVSAGVAVTKL